VKHLVLLLAGVSLLASCTERLTTPGGCPALCPGGAPEFRDTVLTAVPLGDSAFTGYSSPTDGASLLVSNSAVLGESRALIRFNPRGDSVLAGDSLKPFTIDSVVLSVFLQARDTLVGGIKLDVYRLPATFDSLTTFAELDAAMVPATLLRTIDVTDAARSGRLEMKFVGAELDALAFTEQDSTRLVLGLRMRSSAPSGVYVGAAASGDATPLYRTFVVAEIADTTLRKQVVQRGVAENLTLRAAPTPNDPSLLRVGGFPAARSLIRFEVPRYLRDTATIVRATLELVPDAPVVGIAGDSARIDVRAILADFGAKSVVQPTQVGSGWFHPGVDTIRVEVTNVIGLWTGGSTFPTALRAQLGQEHASFLAPVIRSTRVPGGGPRLRITYRTPAGGRVF
jgi:hypothetical protein